MAPVVELKALLTNVATGQSRPQITSPDPEEPPRSAMNADKENGKKLTYGYVYTGIRDF